MEKLVKFKMHSSSFQGGHFQIPKAQEDSLKSIIVCIEDWTWSADMPLKKQHRIRLE